VVTSFPRMGYQHLEIERDGGVAVLWLNRPEKLNALSEDMWDDIPVAIMDLDADRSVRVIIVAGRGRAFTVGIDIGMLASLQPTADSSAAASKQIYHEVKRLQHTVSCLAESLKPVIAAVHGYCLGAGVNLISACDIRLAAADAVFSIRETKMGLVADIGALQRLPHIVGTAVTTEMALTGADYDAPWALERGLVSAVSEDHDGLIERARGIAAEIAANSPLVIEGVKRVIANGSSRSIEEGLDYVARWNSAFLMSNDLVEALSAFTEKRDPDFTGT